MLHNCKRIYALASWTVRKDGPGWFVRRTDHDREEWRGPYTSETSACLVIARFLRKEFLKRDSAQLPV